MGVRSKVAAVAAPEVAAVAHRKRPAADPRTTAPGSKAARDREAIEAIKAKRKPEPDPDLKVQPEDDPNYQAPEQAPSSSPGVGSGLAASVPSTGGGVVLGLIGWAIFRNYLNGTTGQWVNAKLFNKVGGSK